MIKKGNRLAALLLAASLIMTPAYGSVFAEDEENAQPEAEAVYQLTGTVYQYGFSSSESSGSAKGGVEVDLSTEEGIKTVTTDSSGKFEYTLADSERSSDGSYGWYIESDDEHYKGSGNLEEGTEESPATNKLYIRERYSPSSSDYKFTESDSVKTVGGTTWVKSAGTYAIEPTSGKSLSKVLDGTSANSISITVSGTGILENFYVYISGLCSKVLSGQAVKIDSGAPVINSVVTEPANSNTYVKEHGIYGREKAEIVVSADIDEDTSIKEAYLISTVGEETRRYDAVKTTETGGSFNVTIGLPDEETIMDAQLVKLVVVDLFGNKANEVLIAQTEDGSKVTLEQIAPKLEKGIKGSPSEYGWYNDMPTLSATAADTLSGLASLRIYGHNHVIATEDYEEKTTDDHTVSGPVAFDEFTSDGAYIYTAEATDNAGNVQTEEYKVNIDTVAPVVSAEGVKNGEFYKDNPSIKISEDEMYYSAKGNRIFVEITRDGKSVSNSTYEQRNEVNIPQSSFNTDGVYTVTISAKDAADNASNTITYSFTKDATAPVISISGVKEGKFYNKRQTVSVTVKEHNYSSNNVSVSAIKKLGGTKNMGFPWKNKAETTTNSKTYSETGTYTITANANDKAGNSAKTKKVSFTIDTKAPVITITGVKDGGVYTYGQGLNPGAKVEDDYLASKSISFTKGGEPISNPSWTQIKENDGLYTMTVHAQDKAGNTATKTISFTVNRFGSYFEYNDAIKALMGHAVQNVDKDLVVTEKNVSKVISSDAVIYKDGKEAATKGKTEANEGSAEKVYRHIFDASNFTEEGAYEINVSSKDEAGNEMESKTENGAVKFYVDRTEPNLSLSGIDPKGNQAESIDVKVITSDTLTGISDVTATVDGEQVMVRKNEETEELYITLDEGLRQEVKVSSTDGAGNTAEITETASVSASAFKLFMNRFGILIGAVLAAILAGLIFFIAKRRKNDDEEDKEEAEEADD